MVEMTRIAAEVIRSADPAALVVSPSPTTSDGLPWLGKFLDEGGARFVDVIGYHLYVTPAPPEAIVPLTRAVRDMMVRHHVNLPIWDTETGWSGPKNFDSPAEQAAYVARSLVLGWAFGVSRFYWYAWDNRNWVTLNLTAGDDYRPTAAAQAFTTVEAWMHGQRVESCARRTDGTWVCHLTKEGKDSYIIWNPDTKTRFVPPSATGTGEWRLTQLNGAVRQTVGSAIYADQEPELVH
jgi:hypothetical protein